jgi:hypothetical protein
LPDADRLALSRHRATQRDSIRLTGNAPKLYVKTGGNGRKRLQYFCPDCGTPLFTAGEGALASLFIIPAKERVKESSMPAVSFDSGLRPGSG